MVRVMCGVQLIDTERIKDLTLMFNLNETIDQLVMAYNAHWYGHV